MSKVSKGSYGYIKRQKFIELVKTLVFLFLSFGLYYMGVKTTGSNKNYLTLVAVLGCLPMAKFAVNFVLFLRAKGCSVEVKNILDKKNAVPLFYDLYFTTFKKNFQVSALSYKKKNLIMLSEDKNISAAECEEHITGVLKNCGYDDVTVKLFTDADKFADRVLELDSLMDEGKDITFLKDNILNVSI